MILVPKSTVCLRSETPISQRHAEALWDEGMLEETDYRMEVHLHQVVFSDFRLTCFQSGQYTFLVRTNTIKIGSKDVR